MVLAEVLAWKVLKTDPVDSESNQRIVPAVKQSKTDPRLIAIPNPKKEPSIFCFGQSHHSFANLTLTIALHSGHILNSPKIPAHQRTLWIFIKIFCHYFKGTGRVQVLCLAAWRQVWTVCCWLENVEREGIEDLGRCLCEKGQQVLCLDGVAGVEGCCERGMGGSEGMGGRTDGGKEGKC